MAVFWRRGEEEGGEGAAEPPALGGWRLRATEGSRQKPRAGKARRRERDGGRGAGGARGALGSAAKGLLGGGGGDRADARRLRATEGSRQKPTGLRDRRRERRKGGGAEGLREGRGSRA